MFEVGASTVFRAFHRMPDHPPPENERHPHDYRVEVVAERERLDERGMVCDLDVVTGSLADVADRLRERDLSEICGTEAVTVEILAGWIHERLAEPLGAEGAETLSVRVWESAEMFGGVRARV
jgi:6-pyruvoyltetrahydropterin/6-carboxytetrahydropterin synthase